MGNLLAEEYGCSTQRQGQQEGQQAPFDMRKIRLGEGVF